MTWACPRWIVEKRVCWQSPQRHSEPSCFRVPLDTHPMLDVQGHLVGSLCVQGQPKQTAFHNSLNKDIFGCSIPEMHFTSSSLQMGCFPAETARHPQESLWNKESSLSCCRILCYKRVHFLKLISFDPWLWEAFLKKRKQQQQQDPPNPRFQFLFSLIQVQKRLRDTIRQHSVMEQKGISLCVTLHLWYWIELIR